MSISIKLMKIKKGRLVLTDDEIHEHFGPEAYHFLVIRLDRLIVIGRMDMNDSLESKSVDIAARFGSELVSRPEFYTLSGESMVFTKKWLEEVGKAEDDFVFTVSSAEVPDLMAIQFLSADEIMKDSVKKGLHPAAQSTETKEPVADLPSEGS